MRMTRVVALLLAVAVLQALPLEARAAGGSTYKSWLQGCDGTFSSGACWDGGVPDSTSVGTIAPSVDPGGTCRAAQPVVTKDVTVGGLVFDQGCGAAAGLLVSDGTHPSTVTINQAMNWAYGSAMDPQIEIAPGATAVIGPWPHRRVITSDWTVRGTLDLLGAGLGADDLRAYGAVITIEPAATLSVIGDSGLSSDCCNPPQSGIRNRGTVELLGGSDLTLDTGFDSTGTVDVPSDAVLTLEYPGDLGPTTFSGGGLVDVVDTNNPGWVTSSAFAEPRVYGSITLTGDVQLQDDTVLQVEQSGEVAGIGDIAGTGTLRLGGTWYARSTLGSDVTFETVPGTRARISSWDGRHDGLVGRLVLGRDSTVAPGSMLSVDDAVDSGAAYGLTGGLVVRQKITLTVPDGAVLGTNGCCLSDAQVVVDGRMTVGGGDGGERYGSDFGDDQPGDDPALLAGSDLGGGGTVTVTGTTEWDLDPGHHFNGLWQVGGTVLGDLPVGDATLYPLGPLEITDALQMGDGGSLIAAVSPEGASNQVTAGRRVDLAGELRVTISAAIPQGSVSTPILCHTDGCLRGAFATVPPPSDWQVAYGSEAVTLTRVAAIPVPANWITAWPRAQGTPRVGHRLRVGPPSYSAEATAHEASADYRWYAGSRVVSRTSTLRVTDRLRRSRITVEVIVSAPGYGSRSKTLDYGRAR